MNPSRVGLTLVLFMSALCAAPAFAQGPAYCEEIGYMAGGTIQVYGFSIELKSVPESPGSWYTICRARVVSPEGKTVYEQKDWSFQIDSATGKDINGDGQPDAVLIGYSGGAHCCWAYDIISLGKTPGLIRGFTNRAPATFSDLRGNGQIEISIPDGSFDEGFRLDHPFSVFPQLIVQLKGTRFEDVGAEFWPIFQREIDRKRGDLRAQWLRTFLNSNPYEVHDSLDYQGTKSGILMMPSITSTQARLTKPRQLYPHSGLPRLGHARGTKCSTGTARASEPTWAWHRSRPARVAKPIPPRSFSTLPILRIPR